GRLHLHVPVHVLEPDRLLRGDLAAPRPYGGRVAGGRRPRELRGIQSIEIEVEAAPHAAHDAADGEARDEDDGKEARPPHDVAAPRRPEHPQLEGTPVSPARPTELPPSGL